MTCKDFLHPFDALMVNEIINLNVNLHLSIGCKKFNVIISGSLVN